MQEITGGCFCCKFGALVDASRCLSNQASPDVLIAEPVGSCTDLKATVSYPLRRLHGTEYDVAPLSVMVDPVRCARELGLEVGPGFSESVLYVYRKQLEEAEFIVVNKVDVLSSMARRALVDRLADRFPRARVFEVSCATGEGLGAWFDAVLSGSLGCRAAMDVDYDTYAEGEALLGWLNATAVVSAPASFDGNQVLLRLGERLRESVAARMAEIAHLKMTLRPSAGEALGALSITSTQAAPVLTHRLEGAIAQGELIVNLRAEAAPELLEQLVAEGLNRTREVSIRSGTIRAFRPGRPTPTHRMATSDA